MTQCLMKLNSLSVVPLSLSLSLSLTSSLSPPPSSSLSPRSTRGARQSEEKYVKCRDESFSLGGRRLTEDDVFLFPPLSHCGYAPNSRTTWRAASQHSRRALGRLKRHPDLVRCSLSHFVCIYLTYITVYSLLQELAWQHLICSATVYLTSMHTLFSSLHPVPWESKHHVVSTVDLLVATDNNVKWVWLRFMF